jgi:HSP20 family molecular chaperone IbpA
LTWRRPDLSTTPDRRRPIERRWLIEMLWTDPFEPLVTQLTRNAVFVPTADVTVSEGDIVLTMDVPGLTSDA